MVKYGLLLSLIATSNLSVAGMGNILKTIAPKAHALAAVRNAALQAFTRAYTSKTSDNDLDKLSQNYVELANKERDSKKDYDNAFGEFVAICERDEEEEESINNQLKLTRNNLDAVSEEKKKIAATFLQSIKGMQLSEKHALTKKVIELENKIESLDKKQTALCEDWGFVLVVPSLESEEYERHETLGKLIVMYKRDKEALYTQLNDLHK